MLGSYKKVFDIILLCIISAFLLLPIILIILYSLQTFYSIGYGNWNEWTIENYSKIMDGFIPAFMFTMLIIVFSSLFTIFISITASFAMSQLEFKWKKIMSVIILIPICIPGASIISAEYKLITSLGFTSGGLGFAFGLSLPFCYSFLSYSILKSGYDNLEDGLKDKMITDNISTIDYFTLTLGSVKNEIIWVVLFSCISSWNSYLYPRVMLMGTDFRVITLWLFDVSIESSDFLIHHELQAAASVVASIPLIIFFVVFRKRLFNAIKDF